MRPFLLCTTDSGVFKPVTFALTNCLAVFADWVSPTLFEQAAASIKVIKRVDIFCMALSF